MSAYPFGHHANEWDGEPYLCPYCGVYHLPGMCPGGLDTGPSHVPDEEPLPEDGPDDEGPLPDEPPEVSGEAEHPRWCYGLPPDMSDSDPSLH